MEVIWANLLLGKASKSAATALRGGDHVFLASESLGKHAANFPPATCHQMDSYVGLYEVIFVDGKNTGGYDI